MTEKTTPTHQDALVAKHQSIVNGHEQEEARLAVELCRIEGRREVIKKRLGQIEFILSTANELDPEEKKAGEAESSGKP